MLSQRMGLRWDDFRRMPLSVWRGYVDGYAKSANDAMRRVAWQVSHQLVAAGCDAEEVSVARLLGEKEKARRQELTDEQKFDKMWTRTEKRREAGKLKD